jgi:hypothetical protein
MKRQNILFVFLSDICHLNRRGYDPSISLKGKDRDKIDLGPRGFGPCM